MGVWVCVGVVVVVCGCGWWWGGGGVMVVGWCGAKSATNSDQGAWRPWPWVGGVG